MPMSAAAAAQVTQMFDKAEADARDLQERKRTVEADKHKIYTVRPAPPRPAPPRPAPPHTPRICSPRCECDLLLLPCSI